MARSILLNGENKDYEIGTYETPYTAEGGVVEISVTVDESNNNTSFTVNSYCNYWFTYSVERKDNDSVVIKVSIVKNLSTSRRNGSIYIQHNAANISKTISICQEAADYGLSANNGHYYVFKSMPNEIYEEKTIDLTVVGGREKWYVKEILQYQINEDEYKVINAFTIAYNVDDILTVDEYNTLTNENKKNCIGNEYIVLESFWDKMTPTSTLTRKYIVGELISEELYSAFKEENKANCEVCKYRVKTAFTVVYNGDDILTKEEYDALTDENKTNCKDFEESYDGSSLDNMSSKQTQIAYDKVFNYKIEDNKLIVRSYGQIDLTKYNSTTDGNNSPHMRYFFVLQHSDIDNKNKVNLDETKYIDRILFVFERKEVIEYETTKEFRVGKKTYNVGDILTKEEYDALTDENKANCKKIDNSYAEEKNPAIPAAVVPIGSNKYVFTLDGTTTPVKIIPSVGIDEDLNIISTLDGKKQGFTYTVDESVASWCIITPKITEGVKEITECHLTVAENTSYSKVQGNVVFTQTDSNNVITLKVVRQPLVRTYNLSVEVEYDGGTKVIKDETFNVDGVTYNEKTFSFIVTSTYGTNTTPYRVFGNSSWVTLKENKKSEIGTGGIRKETIWYDVAIDKNNTMQERSASICVKQTNSNKTIYINVIQPSNVTFDVKFNESQSTNLITDYTAHKVLVDVISTKDGKPADYGVLIEYAYFHDGRTSWVQNSNLEDKDKWMSYDKTTCMASLEPFESSSKRTYVDADGNGTVRMTFWRPDFSGSITDGYVLSLTQEREVATDVCRVENDLLVNHTLTINYVVKEEEKVLKFPTPTVKVYSYHKTEQNIEPISIVNEKIDGDIVKSVNISENAIKDDEGYYYEVTFDINKNETIAPRITTVSFTNSNGLTDVLYVEQRTSEEIVLEPFDYLVGEYSWKDYKEGKYKVMETFIDVYNDGLVYRRDYEFKFNTEITEAVYFNLTVEENKKKCEDVSKIWSRDFDSVMYFDNSLIGDMYQKCVYFGNETLGITDNEGNTVVYAELMEDQLFSEIGNLDRKETQVVYYPKLQNDGYLEQITNAYNIVYSVGEPITLDIYNTLENKHKMLCGGGVYEVEETFVVDGKTYYSQCELTVSEYEVLDNIYKTNCEPYQYKAKAEFKESKTFTTHALIDVSVYNVLLKDNQDKCLIYEWTVTEKFTCGYITYFVGQILNNITDMTDPDYIKSYYYLIKRVTDLNEKCKVTKYFNNDSHSFTQAWDFKEGNFLYYGLYMTLSESNQQKCELTKYKTNVNFSINTTSYSVDDTLSVELYNLLLDNVQKDYCEESQYIVKTPFAVDEKTYNEGDFLTKEEYDALTEENKANCEIYQYRVKTAFTVEKKAYVVGDTLSWTKYNLLTKEQQKKCKIIIYFVENKTFNVGDTLTAEIFNTLTADQKSCCKESQYIVKTPFTIDEKTYNEGDILDSETYNALPSEYQSNCEPYQYKVETSFTVDGSFKIVNSDRYLPTHLYGNLYELSAASETPEEKRITKLTLHTYLGGEMVKNEEKQTITNDGGVEVNQDIFNFLTETEKLNYLINSMNNCGGRNVDIVKDKFQHMGDLSYYPKNKAAFFAPYATDTK
jgi:hypothetical protein